MYLFFLQKREERTKIYSKECILQMAYGDLRLTKHCFSKLKQIKDFKQLYT